VLDGLGRTGAVLRRSGSGWVTRCPLHDDARPSLTVAEGRGGKALVRCWAGCPTLAVLEALGLGWVDVFAAPRGVSRP